MRKAIVCGAMSLALASLLFSAPAQAETAPAVLSFTTEDGQPLAPASKVSGMFTFADKTTFKVVYKQGSSLSSATNITGASQTGSYTFKGKVTVADEEYSVNTVGFADGDDDVALEGIFNLTIKADSFSGFEQFISIDGEDTFHSEYGKMIKSQGTVKFTVPADKYAVDARLETYASKYSSVINSGVGTTLRPRTGETIYDARKKSVTVSHKTLRRSNSVKVVFTKPLSATTTIGIYGVGTENDISMVASKGATTATIKNVPAGRYELYARHDYYYEPNLTGFTGEFDVAGARLVTVPGKVGITRNESYNGGSLKANIDDVSDAPRRTVKLKNSARSIVLSDNSYTSYMSTWDYIPAGTYAMTIDGFVGTKSVKISNGKTTKAPLFNFTSGKIIKGTVVDKSGYPVYDGFVQLVTPKGKVLSEVRIDGDGKYRFAGSITPGKYVLRITPFAYDTDWGDTGLVTTRKTITLSSTARYLDSKIVVDTTTRVSGIVKDSSGKALEGMIVMVSSNGSGTVLWDYTDSNGRYSFNGIPANTTFKLRAIDRYNAGYKHKTVKLTSGGKGSKITTNYTLDKW